MSIEVPQIYRVPDVAQVLGITEKAVRWMAYTGELPKGAKINGRLAWKASQIEAYLDAKFAEAENDPTNRPAA